jgi:HTH-type transcriptional regulator/antitoxin HigA
MSAIAKSRGGAARYMELVGQFPLRPLKGKKDYRHALEILDRMATREEGSLSADEQDYMQTLSLLVEEYDNKHEPVSTADVDPIEVLKHLMEENDMNTSDLGRLLGSKGVASEILNGKRSLSKSHMLALAERFNVDVSLFFPMNRTR